MKKEFLIMLFVLGLPTLVIMNYDSITGALVNDVEELRLQRIALARDFPYSPVPFLKIPVYDVHKYLTWGANEHFYGPEGIKDGDSLFMNEMVLVPALLKLMCLDQVGQPNQGLYISGIGWPVHLINNRWYGSTIDYMGNFPCDPVVNQPAHSTLEKIFTINFALVSKNIQLSNCQDEAQKKLDEAKKYYSEGEYEHALDYLKSAWKASTCY